MNKSFVHMYIVYIMCTCILFNFCSYFIHFCYEQLDTYYIFHYIYIHICLFIYVFTYIYVCVYVCCICMYIDLTFHVYNFKSFYLYTLPFLEKSHGLPGKVERFFNRKKVKLRWNVQMKYGFIKLTCSIFWSEA